MNAWLARMKPGTLGRLEIHLAAVLWGMTGLFGKWMQDTPSVVIVFGRTLLGAVVLLLLVRYFRESLHIRRARDAALLVGIGLLVAVHWILFFLSVQVSTVATGLLALATIPVMVALLEPLFFRKRLRPYDLALALCVAAGMMLIVEEYDLSHNITQGVVYGLLAAATAALFTVLNKGIIGSYPALPIAFYNLAIACLATAPWALWELVPLVRSGAFGWREVGLLAVLGVFCTAGSHALFLRGMRYVEAQFAAIVGSLEPVYAILFAAVLLAEIPTPRMMLGGLVVLAGTWVATVASLRRERAAAYRVPGALVGDPAPLETEVAGDSME